MDAEDYQEKLCALDRTLTELQARKADAQDSQGDASADVAQ
jgi:hypothetical protein